MSPRTPRVPRWRIIERRRGGNSCIDESSDSSPLLQIAQSDTIESVRANGRYTAEDDQSTRTPKREVSFIPDVGEPASWWHIPVKDTVNRRPLPADIAGRRRWARTACRILQTLPHTKKSRGQQSGIHTTRERPVARRWHALVLVSSFRMMVRR